MMKRPHLWIPAAILTLYCSMASLTSCTSDNDIPVSVVDDKPFDRDQYIDTSVRPGDDFFRYTCGKWLDDDSIPSLISQATQNVEKVTNQILVKSQDPVISAIRQLVRAAYADDSADFEVLKSRIDYLSASPPKIASESGNSTFAS